MLSLATHAIIHGITEMSGLRIMPPAISVQGGADASKVGNHWYR